MSSSHITVTQLHTDTNAISPTSIRIAGISRVINTNLPSFRTLGTSKASTNRGFVLNTDTQAVQGHRTTPWIINAELTSLGALDSGETTTLGIFRRCRRRAVVVDTYPRAIRAAVLGITAIVRIVNAGLTGRVWTFQVCEAAACGTVQECADTGAVDGDVTAWFCGVVDACCTGGAGLYSSTAACSGCGCCGLVRCCN